MPKSTQTRFLGIRDNHNHYTSLRLLFLIIILMSTHAILGVFLTCIWEELMFSLSIVFILLLIIYDPHATQKASVGMYSGCDYLLSLKILFVCFLALPSLLHPSILFNCFYTCFCYCMSATICDRIWENPAYRENAQAAQCALLLLISVAFEHCVLRCVNYRLRKRYVVYNIYARYAICVNVASK